MGLGGKDRPWVELPNSAITHEHELTAFFVEVSPSVSDSTLTFV